MAIQFVFGSGNGGGFIAYQGKGARGVKLEVSWRLEVGTRLLDVCPPIYLRRMAW